MTDNQTVIVDEVETPAPSALTRFKNKLKNYQPNYFAVAAISAAAGAAGALYLNNQFKDHALVVTTEDVSIVDTDDI